MEKDGNELFKEILRSEAFKEEFKKQMDIEKEELENGEDE
jgi:hypothetical protein